MKGLISIEILITYVVVLLIYIVGIWPIIRNTIASVTGADQLTQFLLTLVGPAFLIAIIIGIFSYSTGRAPVGAWSGEE